jgi:hypothetical protein
MTDQHLLQKSAGKAGELLGLTEWNTDLTLIRIYSVLARQTGSDMKLMRHWVQTPNKQLDGKVPANLLTTPEGELKVLSVLESYLN